MAAASSFPFSPPESERDSLVRGKRWRKFLIGALVMGLLGRVRGRNRWRKRASAWACGWLVCLAPALAQGLPEPPVNSDLAFRILPARYSTAQVETEILKEQPLVRLVVESAGRFLGVDPVWDLLETFDGAVLGAIVSDPKTGSSVGAYFEDSKLRGEHEWMTEQMKSLAADLESYRSENGSYPEDYQNFIEEYRYYDVNLPDGVSYQYESVEGGQGFRLRVSYDETTRLKELGPAPILGSAEFALNMQPKTAPVPLNYTVAVGVKNSQAAKALADKVWGAADNGFWRASPSLVATMRGRWLVVSDRQQNLGPLLKSLNGQGPGWSKNPGFARVAKTLKMDAPLAAYVDIPKLAKLVSAELPPEGVKVLSLLGPAGYTLSPYEESQCRMEAFIGVNPPKGSELEKFFQDSKRTDPHAELVADNIPWDVSNAFAVDYRRGKEFVNALLALSPEVKADAEHLEDVWAGFLGLDAAKGFDELIDGWAVLSFERVDMFVGLIEDLAAPATAAPPEVPIPDNEEMGGPEGEPDGEYDEQEAPRVDSESSGFSETQPAGAEQAAEPESESESESAGQPGAESAEEPGTEQESEAVYDDEYEMEPEAEATPADPTKPARLPFTVAFRVTDDQARDALVKALEYRLGETSHSKTVHGFEVRGRDDGLLSYALQDSWFYISGGKTQRLLRNLLATASGVKPSLTSMDSWSRFRLGQRGKVLAIGHQKLDGVYSLAKAGLLSLGPDFRPLAYELGKLRDYHSAAFVVPDGFVFVGEILQGDGR